MTDSPGLYHQLRSLWKDAHPDKPKHIGEKEVIAWYKENKRDKFVIQSKINSLKLKASKGMKRSKICMTLTGDMKDRYDKKILECGGIDPYTLLKKDLSVDPKDFPDITVLDIGNYMIQSVSPYTKRSFNAYKSTEAYSFFESGFVLSVGSKKTNDLAILMGRRMNETSLKPWILAQMNGKIICAHCNCTAGLSETCSHVAAICFAVSNIGESDGIKSVTDMLCKWNMPSFRDVSMSSAKEIHWRYPSQAHNTRETNFRKYCNSITHLSDETIDNFIKKCHSSGDTTALGTIIIPSDGRRKTNIKDDIFLASLYSVEHTNKSLLQLIEIGKSISLNVSDDEVKEISKITLGKEKSKFYVGLRRGRITGSNFKSCCVTDIENPSLTTINCMLNPRNLEKIPSITYQMRNRKKAVEQYTRKAISDHECFVYSQCGLIINPRVPYFAGSPDGIVSCSCHGNGCVTIKCLKILESGGSFEALTAKPNNILNKAGNVYVLERTLEIFYQVQLQINLISVTYCDLVFWSPNDFLSIGVESDIDFWQKAMKKASTFHQQVLMPEILGKFYTKCNDSQTNHEEKEVQLIGLEIDILCSDEEQKEEGSISSSEDGHGKDCVFAFEHLSKTKYTSESEEKLSQEIKSQNQVLEFQYVATYSEFGVRNLMGVPVEDILLTFSDHEEELKRLYFELVKEPKRNYKSKDLPDLIAWEIMDEKQLQAMAVFAETKLACDIDDELNSTDVIFDAILPEWSLAAFCKKYKLTRHEAIERIKLQRQSLVEMVKDAKT